MKKLFKYLGYFSLTLLIGSSVILIAEIILICFVWIIPFAVFTGKITGWLIVQLNHYIQWLDSLPGSIIDHIYFPISYALLLALIVSVGMYAWIHQHKKYLMIAALFGAVLASLRMIDYYTCLDRTQLIVYAVPKQSAVDIQIGREYSFWGDSGLLYQPIILNFNCKPARTYYQCFNMIDYIPKQSFYATQVGSKQIIFCGRGLEHWPIKHSSQSQIIVIANNSNLPLQEIFQQNPNTYIVWDGSNTLKKVERWKTECKQLHLPAHYVTTDGAFVAAL